MRGGHDYARTINPTRTALEECLAVARGRRARRLLLVRHGRDDRDHGAVLARARARSRSTTSTAAPTGCSRSSTRRRATTTSSLDLTDEGVARQAFEQPADLVWLETPSNPLLKIVDIAAIAERAHAAGALVVVDNTFASPYLQQPLALGADIVVHSTTKYIGGHSDSVGGAAITNDDEIAERLHFVQNSMGAVPGPLDCFLTLRGAKTLAVRMERHCDNAARDRALAHGVAGRQPRLLPGSRDASRPRDREAPDAALRRHDRLPGARAAAPPWTPRSPRPASGRWARASAASRA